MPILLTMIAQIRLRRRPHLLVVFLGLGCLNLACGAVTALAWEHWQELQLPVRLVLVFACAGLALASAGYIYKIFSGYASNRKEMHAMKVHGHTIVCGWNAHSPQLLDHLSPPAGQAKPEVVLINAHEPKSVTELAKQFPRLALFHVQGDFTEEVVLQAAAIASAKAAIIVPDESWPVSDGGRGKDERTILGALAIKSINPGIRLSAMVLQAENEAHLRRAKVDSVLINGEFSDFLLAKSGNAPALPLAARSLLSPGNPNGLRQIPIPAEFKGKSFAELADFIQERNIGILVGVLSKASLSGFDNLLGDDESDTDNFIRRKFQEAAIDLSAHPEQTASVLINPGPDYQIGPNDAAFVVG